jgi:SAM-dependent methyltransferase
MPGRCYLDDVQLTDTHTHYHLDAELFDYFEPFKGPDLDSARRMQESVLHHFPVRSGVIVDAGSGNGWLLDKLGDVRVICVDLGRRNLRRIREKHPEAWAVCADVTRLPFRDNTVNGVVSSEVLEHLNDPLSAVYEFTRITEPKGLVTVSTPYREALRTYLCIHCNKPTPANAHIQTFDEDRLREIFRRARLVEIGHSLYLGKLFMGTRLSYLFRFLPFPLWRLLDAFSMFVYRKAHMIVVTGTKPQQLMHS